MTAIAATAGVLGFSLLATSPADAAPGGKRSQSLIQEVNASLGLRDSEVASLELPALPGPSLTVTIPYRGREYVLEMEPHSVRNDQYELRSQQADGSWVVHDPGPVRTVRGTVLDMPGSLVAGSLLDDGLHATFVLPDGTKMWVQPIGGLVGRAGLNDHAVYNGLDVIPSNGTCGVNDKNLALGVDLGGGGVQNSPVMGGAFNCADLGIDADFQFFQSHGSNVISTRNRIELVINTVNLQYETQVQITHLISTILVRTTNGAPYSSTDAGTLLGQFANEWSTNQSGIARDFAHLFTGKNLQGGTIGIAFLGAVCTGNGYGLVQSDCCGSDACSTDLSAHEIGHNWGAGHCNCTSNTMNPFIVCANNFSAGSIGAIVAFRNTRSCLVLCNGPESGTTTLPFFDDFPTATLDTTLWTGITGAVVDAQGIGEPSPALSLNVDSNDSIRTAIMNTTGVDFVTVSYWWQRTGGANSTEAGDDLFVQYMNNQFQWITINQHLGSGPDMTTYQFETINLPADAMHADFRLQFLATGTPGNFDDWFIDDVSVLTPPPNNSCTSSFTILAGAKPFSTIAATTTGFTESCGNFDSDIWFNYIATCTGTLNISICDANFDTELAMYSFVCPTGPGVALNCNQDSCGTGSVLSIPIVPGFYRIRIGGVGGQTGSGTLNISCTAAAATGACCESSGACSLLSSADCVILGGTYSGDGTDCATANCPLPSGACCAADGTCTTGTSADCTALGGTYSGDGTDCATANCPQPSGACCAADGTCTNGTAADCATAGGTYQGDGTDCATANCPLPCPGDITPAGGNGVVNIDDLVAVLNAFGNCPAPPAACPADITPAGGNGVVNIDDLVAVLNAFGACP